jgi:hypothetical protein
MTLSELCLKGISILFILHVFVRYIGVGISKVFEILERFLFCEEGGNGTTPYGHDPPTIRCSLTQGKRICMAYGVGISTVFEIFSNFPVSGGGVDSKGIPNILHIFPVTKRTRIYIVKW